MLNRIGAAAALLALAWSAPAARAQEVAIARVSDWRPVFGQVESVKRAFARARLTGDLVSLSVTEGDAVAAGMALAFRYSARLGLCPAEDAARVTAHLKAIGLPHDLASAHVSADGATLVGHMLHDKKMAGGTLPFLLARGIGRTFLSKDVALDDVAAFLDQDRADAL